MSHEPTSHCFESSADICRCRRWRVGTLLIEEQPKNPRAPMMLKITAVGVEWILAFDPRREQDESIWDLRCRDWREMTQLEKKAFYSAVPRRIETDDPALVRS